MRNPVFAEKNPKAAQVVDSLISRYEHSYDLTKTEDQATLAEGMYEIGQHVARHGTSGRLEIGVGADGVVRVTVEINPNNTNR